eukprot:10152450-Prorocentrum_lima.AAC.1
MKHQSPSAKDFPHQESASLLMFNIGDGRSVQWDKYNLSFIWDGTRSIVELMGNNYILGMTTR